MLLRNYAFLGLVGLFLLFLADPALAGSAQGLPWEDPLETVRQSLTGPVALVLSILGVAIAGGMLIFGGELGEFARKMVMLVLVISLLVAAAAIVTQLFGGAGAVVALV